MIRRDFTGLPTIEARLVGHVGKVAWWQLVRPLQFRFTTDVDGFSVVVPAGFRTDFASVPRYLWPVFPPTGQWMAAAVVHDYLYRETSCSRFLADACFREAMSVLGVPLATRVAMYYAVRVGGGFARRAQLPTLARRASEGTRQ